MRMNVSALSALTEERSEEGHAVVETSTMFLKIVKFYARFHFKSVREEARHSFSYL